MNREEAARILDPSTSDIEFEKDISHWSERFDAARAMGAEALRMDAKEAIIVMKIRHRFRDADYEKPYCSACNRYVPDANASFCCWCGAKFVIPVPSMLADEAEVEK